MTLEGGEPSSGVSAFHAEVNMGDARDGGTHVGHASEGSPSSFIGPSRQPAPQAQAEAMEQHADLIPLPSERSNPVCIACLPENRGRGIPHLHLGTCTATFVFVDAERAGHCLACHNGWHRRHIRRGNCRHTPQTSESTALSFQIEQPQAA